MYLNCDVQTPRHLRAQAAAYRALGRAAALPGSVVYRGVPSAYVLPARAGVASHAGYEIPKHRLRSLQCRFNSLFGFAALKVKLAAMVQLALSRTPLWPLDLS